MSGQNQSGGHGTSLTTLTCNPLWETTWEVASWREGGTARARASSVQLGGKGVNVARVAERLGLPSVAAVFLGGDEGRAAENWMRDQGRAVVALPQAAPTRRGLVVRADGRAETTFLGPDATLDAAAVAAGAAFVRALPDGSWLAACGSVPGWSEASHGPLADALGQFARRANLVVDSYGPFLDWASTLPLALLKVNRKEVCGLAGVQPEGADLGNVLASMAARRPEIAAWVVTDGPAAAWVLERGQALPESFEPPKVVEVSPTGAGDAFLAALLSRKLKQGMGWRSAVPGALAVASAKTASRETTEFLLP